MRKWKVLIAVIFLMGLMSGCFGDTSESAEGCYDVYYINLNETGLVKEVYEANNSGTEALVYELLEQLKTTPIEKEHFVLLNESIQVEKYLYDGTNLELYMSEAYGALPRTKEVLIRAGLVRTLVQVEGVDSVSFLVAGEPLCDSKGVPIGRLNAQSFIENSGKEINSYTNDTIVLYFTNETGTELVEETRKLYYSSNVSLEQIIVEQLLKGPKNEGHFPTLPSNAKVMSVTTVENTCYVNFDEAFMSGALNVQEQIPIYSIVNSIIENCSISQVQISINGESNLLFRENMQLGEFYKMNRNLIQKEAV